MVKYFEYLTIKLNISAEDLTVDFNGLTKVAML